MSIEGKTLGEEGTPAYLTRFDGVRVPATGYHPVWLDRLADDVTIEGSAMNGVAQGAEAVRSIVTCIRLCPSSPVPGGELAQIQGVGLAVLVPALGIAISARSSDVRAARQLGVLASLPPTCTAPGESSPAPGRVARSSVNKAELKRKLGR